MFRILLILLSIVSCRCNGLHAMEKHEQVQPDSPRSIADLMTTCENLSDSPQTNSESDMTVGEMWRQQAVDVLSRGQNIFDRWNDIYRITRIILTLNSFPENQNAGLKTNLRCVIKNAQDIENYFISIFNKIGTFHKKNGYKKEYKFIQTLEMPYQYTMSELKKCRLMMKYPILYSYPSDKEKALELDILINYFCNEFDRIISNLDSFAKYYAE